MRKQPFWALLAAVALCTASRAHAQGPGPAKPWQAPVGQPPAAPGLPDQKKHEDDPDVRTKIPHVIGHFPHALPHSGGANASPVKDFHMPTIVQAEVKLPASAISVSKTRFSPPTSKGTAMAKGLARFKGGGVLAAVIGALTALFRGLFRRMKAS
jgi:hypothetical protein